MTPQLKKTNLLKEAAFINGKFVGASTNQRFAVKDPATGEVIGEVPEMDVTDCKKAIDVASNTLKTWKKTTAKARSDMLERWYDLMIENKESLAQILTAENGKNLTESRGEIEYGASFIKWFAEEARRAYGDVIPSPVADKRLIVIQQPVGVVGIVTPWNFPNAMITRKLGAALAAGCTAVVKPAHETPFSALALCELANQAGIPEGVINMVTTQKHTKDIGKEMAESEKVHKLSFTGSTGVGKLLMEQGASTIKKISLELGGNAPFIVFNDADVDAAVEGAIGSKFRNTGQTCVCSNRLLIQSGIYDEFAKKLVERVKKFKVGHGFEEGVTHGPLISEAAVEKVKRHVDDAVSKGASIAQGGKHIKGNFYEPTVLLDMNTSMAITTEETFGPVAALYKFSNEDEAIELANDTPFGLAGYFYSRDVGRIWRVAEAMEVGMVGVNCGSVSFESAPFGGIKQSGLGREGSKYGLEEYLEKKFICMSI
ncbi:succinate-semialdehyde dehydrogenase [Basidiobolus meristosporus CBS 931.73]|uniref:Succinate-semialdehyde dehydrogenase n=1 Tax=Basidiobolus meristosporus CBS 931.73 TaxID=1314790 RepID=A0A1Y1X013_9FUNG|nr:succinate-semialdehyde dehydrogenase [Basidiobolus meristosporus CBS 931.73]|eukprot:ORX78975.1 succinate-semialdehyde dehydrogenase [Basidiobolus meristosporus CBS 931.73]